MEDRIATQACGRRARPGPALVGLVAILGITAAWWALALWPAGAAAPEWLARTRAACFGSEPGGLPDAGGWILLVGEPAGMLAMLLAGWGRAVRHDIGIVGTCPRCRAVMVTLATAFMGFAGFLGVRVTRAAAAERFAPAGWRGIATRVDRVAPDLSLVDQRGRRTTLAHFRGHPLLLGFAYGHCQTVCPATVRDLRAARQRAGRPDLAIVIVTLDPWRDTPDRLPMIASMWSLSARDLVLSGSVADVERTLDAYAVVRRRDERTGEVIHANAVLLIDRAGLVTWRVDGGTAAVADLLARLDR